MDFDCDSKMTRRFYAAPESFSGNKIELSVEESRHLRDVLRLRAGEIVQVFDGAGREFLCQVQSFDRRTTRIELVLRDEIEPPAPESNLDLTLAVALLKGEKFDLVVQKAVELGARKIVPLETARADVKFSDERDPKKNDSMKKLERWRRIALEAAKQSGRAFVPQIEAPVEYKKFIENSNDDETHVFFAERAGDNLTQSLPNEVSSLTAIVGAEGGWEAAEVEAARRKKFLIVTLGRRVLRAETAAIAVVALLQHLRGDLR